MACLPLIISVSPASAAFTPLADFNGSWTYMGPLAIEANPNGSANGVWVAENSFPVTRLKKFAPDGQSVLRSIDIAATGTLGPEGLVKDIYGVAVDPATQSVFISDGKNQRVLKYDSSGAFAAQQGGFNTPRGLEFVPGTLFAADSANSQIQKLSASLTPSGTVTNGWSPVTPMDVAVDTATQHLFVALNAADRVDEFDAAGNFVRTIGEKLTINGVASSVAVDPLAKLLYVAKSGHNRIEIFSTVSGAHLTNILGFTNNIKDIAVDPVSHVLYVAVPGGTPRVKRYSYSPAPSCQAGSKIVNTSAVALQLDCSDADGAALAYELVDQPTSGVLSAFDPVAGTLTYTPAGGFDGSDSFSFRASSLNGTSATKTIEITVDQTPPSLVVTAPNPLTNSTASQDVDFTASDSTAIAGTDCKVDGGTFSACSSPFATGALSEGVHTVTVQATDVAANVAVETVAITVDLTPPEIVLEGPGEEITNSTASKDIEFEATDGVAVAKTECKVDDEEFSECTSPFATGDLAIGKHTISIKTTDTAGNVTFEVVLITVEAEPVVKQSALPPPVWEETSNLSLSSGDVYIKIPGTDQFVKLEKDAQVPLGTIVDAAAGRAVVTLANKDKTTYSSTFWGGTYTVLQSTGDKPVGIIKLTEDTPAAGAKASMLGGKAGIAKKKKKKKNGVWGDGKGKYKTSGGGGSASVRGTRWYVADYSNGTYFKVARGKVLVRDFVKKKNIYLTTGESYFVEYKKKKKKKSSKSGSR